MSQVLVYHPEDGVIAPFLVDEYDVVTKKQVEMYEAMSTYGGSFTFYSRAGAEFWLACRAAIRGPGATRWNKKQRVLAPIPDYEEAGGDAAMARVSLITDSPYIDDAWRGDIHEGVE
jgi:hypothetical protein